MVKKKIKKRNAPKFPWFRRRENDKKTRWGFIPINYKGWTALTILVALNVFAANYFDVMNSPFKEVSKFLVIFLLSIAIFILIAEKKTRQ